MLKQFGSYYMLAESVEISNLGVISFSGWDSNLLCLLMVVCHGSCLDIKPGITATSWIC